MTIFEESDERLIFGQRRPVLALVMALFTAVSAFFLLNMVIQGVPRLSAINHFQVMAWAMWLLVALALTLAGAWMTNSAWRGVTVTLERASEQYRVLRAHRLGVRLQDGSLYAIKRLTLEHNDDVQAIGIFLELRSGERLALATVPPHEQASAHDLLRTVRAFLNR